MLVFGEVQGHAAHEPPLRTARLAQVRLYVSGMRVHLRGRAFRAPSTTLIAPRSSGIHSPASAGLQNLKGEVGL